MVRSKKKLNVYQVPNIIKGKNPKTGKRYGVKSTRAIVGSALKEQLGSGKLSRKIISTERKINARRRKGRMK